LHFINAWVPVINLFLHVIYKGQQDRGFWLFLKENQLPVSASSYKWIFKYKLYHLPFWFFYHILQWTITIGSPIEVFRNIGSPYAIKFGFYVIFQAVGVYFNLYYLIPKFLEKGRYFLYIVFVLLTTLCIAALIVPGYYISSLVSGTPFHEMYNIDPANYMYFFKINALPSTAASMTLGMSVKLAKNWIQAKRKQQTLETEKLETELKFLKSQFNPHFLFNTINSIFVLIKKDPSVAADSLAKFSDLLRYQLYECNEHHIPLSQELDYLQNFIELEKLRQDANIKPVMIIERHNTNTLSIAPFILMPFVENAFKHVSREKHNQNWINMRLQVESHQLLLDISNSISTKSYNMITPVNYSGIGL
jgi:hypothetical protein